MKTTGQPLRGVPNQVVARCIRALYYQENVAFDLPIRLLTGVMPLIILFYFGDKAIEYTNSSTICSFASSPTELCYGSIMTMQRVKNTANC